MSDIDRQIAARVNAFVQEIASLARDAAVASISAAFHGRAPAAAAAAVAPAAPKAAKAAPKAAPRASARGGAKRSPAELDKLIAKVEQFINDNPGLRMEQINKPFNLPTKDLVLPIKKLLEGKKIRAEGTRRSTKYFPGGAAAPAAEAAPAKGKRGGKKR